ncbi:MAG: M24 family metallopeptidase, partial [Halobacteriovoraceae bacterium]|nr:M24 family metallopeptidase [Halobacteriovoraceae bacterium]
MTKSSFPNIESVGPRFSLEKFNQAREMAWEMLKELSDYVKPGMRKEDILLKINSPSFYPEREKWWHPIKLRLKSNTQCSFRDIDQIEETLQKGDLFFFDIGPVFNSHEADVGQTYQLGYPQFKNPAETLFNELNQIWKEEGLTGEKLYLVAKEKAENLELEFNPKMTGHRLSEFPHALHHKGPLGKHN